MCLDQVNLISHVLNVKLVNENNLVIFDCYLYSIEFRYCFESNILFKD